MSKINPKLINEVFSDDILNVLPADKNINKGVANYLKANDPSVKKNLIEAQNRITNDPDKVKIRNKAARRGGDTKKNSSEYQQLMTEVNRKKAKNPKFAENVRKGILKKLEDPAYLVSREEGNKKKYKQIQDPNGKIWPSRKDAAKGWNMIPQTISKLVKKSNSGWKYV